MASPYLAGAPQAAKKVGGSHKWDVLNPPGPQKLVIIGAGSMVWTEGIILSWLLRRPKGEWEIALVDINPEALDAIDKITRRYMLTTETPAKITATTERRDVLAGATVVASTIGVGSRRGREHDVFIPRKYGIFQPVGDTCMPGGVSRAMRTIPPLLDIANDAHRLCPNARFINYSNPMTANVRALHKFTQVRAVGLCDGVQSTLDYLADTAGVSMESLTAKWAGVNHLTWITEIRSDGKDLWPSLRKTAARQRAAGELSNPFAWEIFDEFGGFPAAMDRHIAEFFADRFPQGKYYGKTLGVDVFPFEGKIRSQEKQWQERLKQAKIAGPLAVVDKTKAEHRNFWEVLDSIWHDRRRWSSANLVNRGIVGNLPNDAVVEVAAAATSDGLVAPAYGDLPPAMAAVILRRVAAVEATVEAAVKGNRKLMAEAMMLDSGCPDYPTALKLTEEFLKAHAENLPQFA